MELAQQFDYDLSKVTPRHLHSIGHHWFTEGKISFTQYSLLSIPCELSSASNAKNQPFDAIQYFKEMKIDDFAKGVPDQLSALVNLLAQMSVKTA